MILQPTTICEIIYAQLLIYHKIELNLKYLSSAEKSEIYHSIVWPGRMAVSVVQSFSIDLYNNSFGFESSPIKQNDHQDLDLIPSLYNFDEVSNIIDNIIFYAKTKENQ